MMRSFYLFLSVVAFLRKDRQPKFEATGPIEVKSHESVSAEDTIAKAEALSFGTPEEACSYCYQESFMKGIFPEDPATGQSMCMCLSFAKGSGHEMYCATPSQLGYAKEQEACMCVEKNMEKMGATTLRSDPLSPF